VNTLGIGIRLWLWAAVIRMLKRIMPIGTLVRLAHKTGPGSDQGQTGVRPGSDRDHFALSDDQQRAKVEERLRAYLERKGRFPFRPPSNCLERSLGAYRLLCGVAADPQLVVGVRRSPERGVEGHVWVTARGCVLAERLEDLATFTTIVTFDANGRQRTTAGFEGALSEIPVP
jgi:hypothetical protein